MIEGTKRVWHTSTDAPRLRPIGALGTAARGVVNIGVLVVAVVIGIKVRDALVGLVAANVALAGLLALCDLQPRHYVRSDPLGIVSTVIGVAFFAAAPVAAMLFYGTAMVLAAAVGSAGCEVFAVSNSVRRRDDQIGCPLCAPIDAIDAEHESRRPAS